MLTLQSRLLQIELFNMFFFYLNEKLIYINIILIKILMFENQLISTFSKTKC